VADCGGERQLDDHGDGARCERQSGARGDGGARRHGWGQYPDATRGHDQCERGDDGDAGVHAGRVEDDLGDDRRDRGNADGDGGRERGGGVGRGIDGGCHVDDDGGERDAEGNGGRAGCGMATITVTARDASGNPVQGATVTLAATPTAGNTVTQPLGTTDASGVVTGSLSSTAAGSKTVSAAIDGVAVTQTATVVVNA